jgi:phage shock protein PspC (stress-responsive transcriptional regulator)
MSCHFNAGQNCSATLHRPLQRSIEGRVLGGVAAGLSSFFEIDVLVVRALLVVLTFLSGIGVAMYLALWALLADAGSKDVARGDVYMRSWFK